MLKKLRQKFIALNMLTIAAVIVVVFTAIVVINYQQSLASVHEAMEASINDAAYARDNRFGGRGVGGMGDLQDQFDILDEFMDEMMGQGVPPRIGGNGADSIPIAVYRVTSNGTMLVNAVSSAYLIDDDLSQAFSFIQASTAEDGTIDSLGIHFIRRTVNQQTYIAFADVSTTSGWQDLAVTLTIVGIIALLVFFVIALFFSKWALRPVEEAWDKQRQFVSDASHDLKTPLTVILANSSILLDNADQTVAHNSQWVESTQTEAVHMKQLVDDLLTMAQIDEGDTTMPVESIDLSTVAQGEFLEFESVAYDRHVVLESNVEDGITIQGTPARIRRLISTLIDNACKYAPANSVVTLSLARDAGQAVLSVHNAGDPIPPEDLPHVFDRFYRVDKARTNDGDSHGLGLAIAYGIAQEHGGTLAVESTAEAGTTFTATLPCAG